MVRTGSSRITRFDSSASQRLITNTLYHFYLPGYGNVVQEQTNGETTPVISNSAILTPPLLENCNKVKEHFEDHSSICDDSSPAMQHLIKVVRILQLIT